MKLIPIKNTFIFTFQEAVTNQGLFEKNTTEAGIILRTSFDDSAKESRWVTVSEVGPQCSDICKNAVILLPALRWTAGAKFDDQMVWKSDESQAVAIKDASTGDALPLRDNVIFKPYTEEERVSLSGIVIVGNPNMHSPRGIVVAVGPDCMTALVGDLMYYDDTNFTDTFTVVGEKLAFIKEDKILVLG